MVHRLLPGSKLSNQKLGRLIDFFALEVPAGKSARMVQVNRNTAQRVYHNLRVRIARACEAESIMRGNVEVDESYFGGHRKGMRGRGAAAKVSVFGLLKRNGKVYTKIAEDVSRYTLQGIIRKKVAKRSTVYSDGFSSYDGLVAYGYKHRRINHDAEFAHGKKNHINGIENFWGWAKTRLRRYHGIDRRHFPLFLKEMEFRFNHRNDDLRLILRRLCKKRP